VSFVVQILPSSHGPVLFTDVHEHRRRSRPCRDCRRRKSIGALRQPAGVHASIVQGLPSSQASFVQAGESRSPRMWFEGVAIERSGERSSREADHGIDLVELVGEIAPPYIRSECPSAAMPAIRMVGSLSSLCVTPVAGSIWYMPEMSAALVQSQSRSSASNVMSPPARSMSAVASSVASAVFTSIV